MPWLLSYLMMNPGRSTGYPALPPQSRTWRFPSYGSSEYTSFRLWITRPVSPCLAHNIANPAPFYPSVLRI